MNTKNFLLIIFLLTLILHFPFRSFSQEQRLEFNVGIGPPIDAFHAGLNFHISHKFDVGLNFGTIPDKWVFGNHINVGGEIKYKFGESKYLKARKEVGEKYKKIRLKTWYWGLRGNFVKNIATREKEKKFIYITPAIGRHLNINKALGFNIDFGLSFTVEG